MRVAWLRHPALEIFLVEPLLQQQVALLQRLEHPGPHLLHHRRLLEVVERPFLETGHRGLHLRTPENMMTAVSG